MHLFPISVVSTTYVQQTICKLRNVFLSECGKSPRDFNPSQTLTLIHAGRNSSRGDFPWMAGLYAAFDEGKWRQICGGTLISTTLVLTGTRCISHDVISSIHQQFLKFICLMYNMVSQSRECCPRQSLRVCYRSSDSSTLI